MIRVYSIQSCGHRHAWCHKCRPNLIQKGLRRKYSAKKLCGKSHAYCKVCRPDVSTKIGETSKKVWKRSPERRNTLSIRIKGSQHSAETRAKMSRSNSKAARRNAILNLPNCGCWIHNPITSRLSQRMIDAFLNEFPAVEQEVRFGSYTVDAYLPPPYHLAFEADGSYWHSLKPGYDKKRDAYLLAEHNLPVIRLTENEINRAYERNNL